MKRNTPPFKVVDAEERYKDLLQRKAAIEKESKKALERIQGFSKFANVLQGVNTKAKAKLSTLRDGPKVNGKSTHKDLEAINSWYLDCNVRQRRFLSLQDSHELEQ